MRERRLEEVEVIDQVVRGTNRKEVRTARKRMRGGKAVGPDGIPVEAWRSLEELAVTGLTKFFNKLLESEKIPEELKKC